MPRRPMSGAGPSWPGSRPSWRPKPARSAPAPAWRRPALLDESQYVTGTDAYLAWLQDRHDQAIEQLPGTHFDISPELRTIEVVLARGSTSGAAYYTPPGENLNRP